jgi:hypothetical protein
VVYNGWNRVLQRMEYGKRVAVDGTREEGWANSALEEGQGPVVYYGCHVG